MASVALFAVGSSLGGAVAGNVGALALGAAGSLIGSVIDNQFLFPPPSNDIVGPRLDNLALQSGSEGSPIHFDLGPENKHAGNVIWVGMHNGKPFEERTSTQDNDSKGSSGGSQTSYSYYVDIAVAFAEGEVNAIARIWADSKVIYQRGTDDDRYEGLTLYTGSESAPADATMTANTSPDSHIEAFEGSGNVPKYKGVSYIVIDSLNIDDFGRRIPNFSALVEAQSTLSVRDAIGILCERAGLTSAQYDVTRVSECLFGYSFTGPVSMAKVLEPILLAYDIIVQERDGVVHFFHRGDELEVTVGANDFPASLQGGPTDYPLAFSQVMDRDIPTIVNARYIDADADYGPGEEKAQRINILAENVDTVSIPLVIPPSKAASIAKRRLYRAYIERLRIAIKLPYSYIRVQEGDVLNVTHSGETYRMLVESRDRGDSGILSFECIVQDISASLLSEDDNDAGTNSTTEKLPYTFPTINLEIIEVAALVDGHVSKPGVYFTTSLDPATEYRGGGLYTSGSDVDSGFSLSQALPPLGITGASTTTLAAPTIAGAWDLANSVTVSVTGGTLVSATQLEVLNGANIAYLGGELIGFTTATLVSTGVYTLSGLIRGLRHTQLAMATHTSADVFVLLAPASTTFDEVGLGLLNSTRYYRAVTSGATVGDFTSDSELIDGDTVKPFSPTHVTGSRDGSNNLTIDWVRRTRVPSFDVLSSVIAPNVEGQEVYEIDILSGTGGTVVRTITITDAVTSAYSAANQTTDGLTPGDPVFLIMYQVDATFGRGFPTTEQSI